MTHERTITFPNGLEKNEHIDEEPFINSTINHFVANFKHIEVFVLKAKIDVMFGTFPI